MFEQQEITIEIFLSIICELETVFWNDFSIEIGFLCKKFRELEISVDKIQNKICCIHSFFYNFYLLHLCINAYSQRHWLISMNNNAWSSQTNQWIKQGLNYESYASWLRTYIFVCNWCYVCDEFAVFRFAKSNTIKAIKTNDINNLPQSGEDTKKKRQKQQQRSVLCMPFGTIVYQVCLSSIKYAPLPTGNMSSNCL